ncbi:hypothetical protein EU528_01740 [Candidatus Thorarchaeota archaeon]|nr:MAG: hypothetical protein EU528_01740 [Candidatus Thorarchaeota archaeon]
MDNQRLVLGILLVSMFLLIGTVTAQDDIVTNIPRTDEYLYSGETNSYVADLEAGHWTVVANLDPWYELEVKITVSWDISGSNIVTVSGNDAGNFPYADFTLNSSSIVYIAVSENSVYHDTSGYYDIGIYDDSHVPGILPSIVSNVPRTDEYLYSGSTNSYVTDLEAGHWTVVIEPDWDDIEVKITVSWDISGSNIIAVSGSGTGNHPRIDFTLNSSSTVYIAVSENSVYHDTSGYYDIGIYDDSHVPGFLASLDEDDWIFIIIIVVTFVPICIGSLASYISGRKGREVYESIAVEAPIHVIPDKHQKSIQSHGSQTTTVRLPLKCPSCGAEVSHEGVDWVGPLEAKCGYCGGTMRATFERV